MATPVADSIALSGTPQIDGLLQGGSWQFSGPRILTYSLHAVDLNALALAPMAPAVSSAVIQAFNAWSSVANVSFQQLAAPLDFTVSGADLAVTALPLDLPDLSAGAGGLGIFPDTDAGNQFLATLSDAIGVPVTRADYPRPEGDIFIVESGSGGFGAGQGGFSVALHEIGHALGLKHPHDDGLNGRPTFASLGIGDKEDGLWTLMSYDHPTGGSFTRGNQVTPMPLDILAIQHIYGANMSYRTGNDTYTLAANGTVRTIWDAGGIDTFNAAGLGSPVVIDLNPGVFISHGADSVTVIAYNVTIENATGTAYSDQLVGNGANNVLNGLGSSDVMTGGLGNDTYVVDHLSDSVIENPLGGTADTVQSSISYALGTEFENLILSGSANLTATGNAAANALTGNAGNNVLDGGPGADSMAGGAGNDTYELDDAGDVVNEAPNAGIDLVRAPFSYALAANFEDLTLTGAGDIDATGNAANNVITGNSGANVLTGGVGNDTYVIDALDTVNEGAGEGSDTIRAGFSYSLPEHFENLTLTGADPIDATGNAADNQITGNAGDNILNGGGGNDTMAGAGGDDTYFVVEAGDSVTEAANAGHDTVNALRSFILPGDVEDLTLLAGSAAISATGNAQDNILQGNRNDNTLLGGGGNDQLFGLRGDDSMAGGAGNDSYFVNSAGDSVSEAPASGSDTVVSALSLALGANLENLTLTGNARWGAGNQLNNAIAGNARNNTLDGGAGNDVLDGGAGFDTLIGGAGNDSFLVDQTADRIFELAGGGTDTVRSTAGYYRLGGEVENLIFETGAGNAQGFGNGGNNALTGNAGDNTLAGGEGNDTLAGGEGNDTLMGGAGADTFVFDTAPGAGNVDTVADFVSGADQLRFDNGIFTAIGPAGTLAAGAFNSGNISSGQDASDRLIYNTTTGALYYDADGSGAVAAVQVAQLSGAPALTAADIAIIA